MRLLAVTASFAMTLSGCAGPGASSPTTTAAPQAPAATAQVVTVIERDGQPQLRVTIAEARITTFHGERSMSVYISDGLAAKGQAEVVFIVDAAGKAEPPEVRTNVLELMGSMFHLASSGNSVGPKSVVRLPTPVPLGPSSATGLLFARARAIPGVPMPRRALVGIPLIGHEIEAVELYGRARLLARLGSHHREFPYAYWLELGRPPVVDEQMLTSTRLHGSGRLLAPWLRVLKLSDRILLRVVRDARTRGAAVLTARDVSAEVVLIPNEDTTADHAFVWVPGSASPVAISATGSVLRRGAVSFLVIVPGNVDRAVFVEDGVAMFLSTTAWDQIRRAIFEGKSTVVAAAGDRPAVEIEVVDEQLADPDIALPATNVQERGLQEIQLLTADADLKRRTTTEAMIGYLRAIEAATESALGASVVKTSVLLSYSLDEGRDPELHIVNTVPELSPALSEALVSRLRALPAPRVGGPVSFRIKLTTGR